MNSKIKELKGQWFGQRFTTRTIPGKKNNQLDLAHLRWGEEEGQAWRLRRLARANEPWILPGTPFLFKKKTISDASQLNFAAVVVSGAHSGISSFYNWLPFAYPNFPLLIADLREVERKGHDVTSQMEALSGILFRQLEAHDRQRQPKTQKHEQATQEDFAGFSKIKDPIELIVELAKHKDEIGIGAIAMRGYEALSRDSTRHLFDGLHAHLEDPHQPLADLGIVLLGHSVRALDPERELPISPLLNNSEVYTTTSLTAGEIEDLCDFSNISLSPKEMAELLDWTGREFLLVQAVFKRMQDEATVLHEAITFLENHPLPAFGDWAKSLIEQLANPGTHGIIEGLLRREEYPSDPSRSIFDYAELFVDNWIVLDTDSKSWQWRSQCRRQLAQRALDAWNFGGRP